MMPPRMLMSDAELVEDLVRKVDCLLWQSIADRRDPVRICRAELQRHLDGLRELRERLTASTIQA